MRREAANTLSHSLAASRLLSAAGGCIIWDGFPAHGWFEALRAEAEIQYSAAEIQECPIDDTEEIRGGTPSRSLLTAGGGSVQDAFYADANLLDALSQLCGARISRSGTRGSYNFYARDLDFLGLHRDVDECDVAVITLLHDNSPPGVGATLVAYPDRYAEPLSAIRASPYDGARAVDVRPGQSIVLAGGLIPHCVTPAAPGQLRVISALCFQIS